MAQKASGNGDPALDLDGISSVQDEIDEDLGDIILIGLDLKAFFARCDADLDWLGNESVEHEAGFLHQIIEGNEGCFADISTAENQKLPSQGGSVFARVFDMRSIAIKAVCFFEFVHQHAAISHDDGEDIIEVVGDSADEFAKNLEFLGMRKLVAEGLPFLEELHFLYGPTNGRSESGWPVFENVICRAFFKRHHGRLFAHDP